MQKGKIQIHTPLKPRQKPKHRKTSGTQETQEAFKLGRMAFLKKRKIIKLSYKLFDSLKKSYKGTTCHVYEYGTHTPKKEKNTAERKTKKGWRQRWRCPRATESRLTPRLVPLRIPPWEGHRKNAQQKKSLSKYTLPNTVNSFKIQGRNVALVENTL